MLSLAVCLIGAATAYFARKHPEHGNNDFVNGVVAGGNLVSSLGFLGFLFWMVISSLTIVPANHVGVVTTFGSWSGTRAEGLSLVQPWSTVDTFGTRNQKSQRDKAQGGDDCVSVKLKGGASACVNMTVLYTIDADNAEKLWRGWGGFEKLNADLINRSTDDAAGEVYGDYTAETASSGDSRAPITKEITNRLEAKLKAQGVTLNSVTLGDIFLPQDVQDRINGILAADARLVVAQKEKQKAEAEAAANAVRRETPESLYLKCLEAAREIKPQVFNCGGGGQVPVIVGTK